MIKNQYLRHEIKISKFSHFFIASANNWLELGDRERERLGEGERGKGYKQKKNNNNNVLLDIMRRREF